MLTATAYDDRKWMQSLCCLPSWSSASLADSFSSPVGHANQFLWRMAVLWHCRAGRKHPTAHADPLSEAQKNKKQLVHLHSLQFNCAPQNCCTFLNKISITKMFIMMYSSNNVTMRWVLLQHSMHIICTKYHSMFLSKIINNWLIQSYN